MVYLPATFVMIGLAVLFIGFMPQIATFIWLYLYYSFFVVYLGKLLKVPDYLTHLTPYGWVPRLPVEKMDSMPLIVSSVIALVLIIAGMISYRKRDITG